MIIINNTDYHEIINMESRLAKHVWHTPSAKEMENTAYQIGQIALANTVSRSYIKTYGLSNADIAFESDGAHTNLMSAVVDRALSYLYGPSYDDLYAGYTYREIMEAIRRHDLPENIIGDIPDNGNDIYSSASKRSAEELYQHNFSLHSPAREVNFGSNVERLLLEMEYKRGTIGKMLYVADKVCAIIMVLCYDSIGEPPVLYASSPMASQRDKKEMRMCDKTVKEAGYYASELWSIDFFKLRRIVDYDETGYFTALLVMYTLQVRGTWYSWY